MWNFNNNSTNGYQYYNYLTLINSNSTNTNYVNGANPTQMLSGSNNVQQTLEETQQVLRSISDVTAARSSSFKYRPLSAAPLQSSMEVKEDNNNNKNGANKQLEMKSNLDFDEWDYRGIYKEMLHAFGYDKYPKPSDPPKLVNDGAVTKYYGRCPVIAIPEKPVALRIKYLFFFIKVAAEYQNNTVGQIKYVLHNIYSIPMDVINKALDLAKKKRNVLSIYSNSDDGRCDCNNFCAPRGCLGLKMTENDYFYFCCSLSLI